jgi:hypothetical protein
MHFIVYGCITCNCGIIYSKYKASSFAVEPLKMAPKGQNMESHINNWIIYIKVVYTGWLDIPRLIKP